MQRFLIKVANVVLLVITLIGIPAVTRARLGNWQVSSVSLAEQLMLYGLACVAIGNAMAALFLIKGRKERTLCWEWAVVFGGLLAVQWGYIHGYFNFNWLKQTLLWFQKRL